MPSDYSKITQYNIVRRGTEFDDIGKFLSQTLYSDRSHFVYELLQNAEDALNRRRRSHSGHSYPKKVTFVLFKDRLEFRHYGQPFDEEDVRGISDVLKGTKASDRNQIGRFGIGFKSVYSFTLTPKVHSGDEHFVIERYIRPEGIAKLSDLDADETVFVFPFDHNDITPEDAFSLIKNRLQSLGTTVLLFLKHINEIEWKIPESDEDGQYLKDSVQIEKDVRRVTLIGQDTSAEENEEWLVFEKTVEVPPVFQDATNGTISVEVAFKYAKDVKEPEIINLSNSSLVVFFPTETETHFGFLMQGPYLTTPARDNIPKHDPWNQHLMTETAELLRTAVPKLKDMGLLGIRLLEGLITREESYQEESLFRPLAKEIEKMFREDALLPANDGTFTKAKDALLGRGAELRNLLGVNQLSQLYDNPNIKWLSGDITADRTPKLREYLMRVLEIEEVDPSGFAHLVNKTFLERQADAWMISFYSFLLNQKTLWRAKEPIYDSIGPLRPKPIIRLENGEHTSPFREDGLPNAYRASQGISDSQLPLVKTAISDDKNANDFLKALGIPEIDIVAEVVEYILPKYRNVDQQVSLEEHLGDMVKISKAYTTDSQERKRQLLNALEPTRFILSKNAANKQVEFQKPEDVYLPTELLRCYFAEDNSTWFVSNSYDHSALALFEDLGIKDVLKIKRRASSQDHFRYVTIQNQHGKHMRGLGSYDPLIEVPGLEQALNHITLKTALYIWKYIAIPYKSCICGEIERSRKKTYENSTKHAHVSSFGELLRNNKWLPDKDGVFNRPDELQLEDLPDSFTRNEDLAVRLQMKGDTIAHLANEAGIDIAVIEAIKANPVEIKKWMDKVNSSKNRPHFPERSSANPERRAERLNEHIDESPDKKYEQRTRGVRVTSGQVDKRLVLKELYTNDDEILVCQICKEQMPFKKRNGDFYFEAVEMFSRSIFKKEHEAQYLALCPVCAARYNEFVINDEETMAILKEALINAEAEHCEVELQMGDVDTSIRFVETHFRDIKTILSNDA